MTESEAFFSKWEFSWKFNSFWQIFENHLKLSMKKLKILEEKSDSLQCMVEVGGDFEVLFSWAGLIEAF